MNVVVGQRTRRQAVKTRAQYTGEPISDAMHTSRQACDLDRSTGAQRRMRAQLAIYLLNSTVSEIDARSEARLRWHDSFGLLVNWLIFSPRYNELVLMTDMPGHLAGKICDFPGIRVDRIDGSRGAITLRHIPTAGRLTFQYLPAPRRRSWRHGGEYGEVCLSQQLHQFEKAEMLTSREASAMDALPVVHPDAEVLLAAVTSRLSLSCRAEGWSVDALVWRSTAKVPDSVWIDPHIHCWGTATDWVLRWGGSYARPASDIAQALTHPVVGLAGAWAEIGVDRSIVYFGEASLVVERDLRPTRAHTCGVAQ
ncbi:hypothetical protein [Nocardia sp. NPDC055049]